MSIGEILGLIIVGVFGSGGVIALIVFAIKAQIHKQIAPYKKTVSNLETKVTLFEQSHDTIIELLEKIESSQDKIPAQIKEGIEEREKFFDLKYVKKP